MLDLHISEYLLPNELVDSVASAVLLNPSTLSWAGRRKLQPFRMVAFYARFPSNTYARRYGGYVLVGRVSFS
jgi:hypothetical protein